MGGSLKSGPHGVGETPDVCSRRHMSHRHLGQDRSIVGRMEVSNLVYQRTIEGLLTGVSLGVAKAVKPPQNGHRSERDHEELGKAHISGFSGACEGSRDR